MRAEVDGHAVELSPGATVLDALRAAEVEVPTLCWDERLRPYGSCRTCMVAIDRAPGLVPACATPCADGDVIRSDDPGAHEAARGALELILSTLPERALELPRERSELVRACELLGVERGRFAGARPGTPRRRFAPVREAGPRALHRMRALRANVRRGPGHLCPRDGRPGVRDRGRAGDRGRRGRSPTASHAARASTAARAAR